MEPARRMKERNKKIKAKAELQLQLPHVPEEILLRILSKLPVESLFQFRLVSKSWRSLISGLKFNLSTQRQQIIIVSKWVRHERPPSFSIHLIDEEASIKKLPKPKPLAQLNSSTCVPIIRTWREIRFPYNIQKVESGPVVNGRLHWLAADRSREEEHFSRTNLIVCFDPQTNQVPKVPLPQREIMKEKIVLGLGVLEGCLSMALYDRKLSVGGEVDVEVLAMKKYGVETSWTSLFIASNLVGLDLRHDFVPLCYATNGEVLMQWPHWRAQNNLVYNPKHNVCWNFPIPANHFHINAAMFVQSLVSPTSYNWEEGGEYMESFLSGKMTRKRKSEPRRW